jgi:hypothetical protein
MIIKNNENPHTHDYYIVDGWDGLQKFISNNLPGTLNETLCMNSNNSIELYNRILSSDKIKFKNSDINRLILIIDSCNLSNSIYKISENVDGVIIKKYIDKSPITDPCKVFKISMFNDDWFIYSNYSKGHVKISPDWIVDGWDGLEEAIKTVFK